MEGSRGTQPTEELTEFASPCSPNGRPFRYLGDHPSQIEAGPLRSGTLGLARGRSARTISRCLVMAKTDSAAHALRAMWTLPSTQNGGHWMLNAGSWEPKLHRYIGVAQPTWDQHELRADVPPQAPWPSPCPNQTPWQMPQLPQSGRRQSKSHHTLAFYA